MQFRLLEIFFVFPSTSSHSGDMKLRRFCSICVGYGLTLMMLAAAEPRPIYQQGWIDLNKDGKKNVYEDASRPVEKRVEDLLKRMTIDEKIGQLWQVDWPHTLEPQTMARLRDGTIGSYLGSDVVVESPIVRNQLMHVAIEQSRLGIPPIFGHDVIHGFRTAFPIPLAQACAWEPDLFERTTAIAAREACAAGIDWTFAPMVDVARDPRWGRIAEGFGEDPWLGMLYGAACVRGFQGTNVVAPHRVVACVKHYVGYGAPEGGRDYNTTEISDYALWNFYLPQFKAAIDAGVLTVMSSFNCLSGYPATATKYTLTDILRHDWKFRGFVVSDYEAVGELIDHGVAADEAEAARLALTSGVDMEMISRAYHDTLKAQVEDGIVPRKTLDEAVRRVLRVKFEKGLFDRPYTDESLYQTAYLRPDALALSREAAAKACVLLKNENGTLPLSPSKKKIAVIGPLAQMAEELVGPWHSRAHANDLISFADAIRNAAGSHFEVSVTRGCALVEPGVIKVPRNITDFKSLEDPPTKSNEIAKAVALAKSSDIVLLAVGEPLEWSGEDASRSDLGLPGMQQQLFDALAASGKPVVTVLFNGRPLAITRVQEKAAAILEAWFPGTEGADGVADVLFGKVDPSGRLTTTFPRAVGQVPFYYNHYNTGRPGFGDYKGNYVDIPTVPLYPFGYGLAYTSFRFGTVQLQTNKISLHGKLQASVEIQNIGHSTGTAVAELYIRALVATAGSRPVRELKGFKKVLLKPGESYTAKFVLPATLFGYYDSRGHWLLEPGQYRAWVSKDSASGDSVSFELTR